MSLAIRQRIFKMYISENAVGTTPEERARGDIIAEVIKDIRDAFVDLVYDPKYVGTIYFMPFQTVYKLHRNCNILLIAKSLH